MAMDGREVSREKVWLMWEGGSRYMLITMSMAEVGVYEVSRRKSWVLKCESCGEKLLVRKWIHVIVAMAKKIV